MNWQPSAGGFDPGESPPTPGTKTAVICDDVAALARVLRLLADLAGKWDFRLDPCFWSFDELSLVSQRSRAGRELADADFIVVSLSRSQAAPKVIAQWLEHCLAARPPRSITRLTHAATNEGWSVAFRDLHGMLTPKPELPGLFAAQGSMVITPGDRRRNP